MGLNLQQRVLFATTAKLLKQQMDNPLELVMGFNFATGVCTIKTTMKDGSTSVIEKDESEVKAFAKPIYQYGRKNNAQSAIIRMGFDDKSYDAKYMDADGKIHPIEMG
jgi:hypothetical protein